jgi:citronellol/citronellal dehydrogenase
MGRSCTGQVAIVTGGSRGIGRAIALRLVSEGAAVALLARDLDGVRFGRSLAGTRDEILERGGTAIAIVADLADPASPREAIIDQVEAELGPVDVLVNNAAMAGHKSFSDWTDKQLRAMQEVNNWAPWQLSRRVLPGMVERGRGWIVNISSGSSLPAGGSLLGAAAYGGTKAMLNQWTAVLARELVGTGVVVNALAPQGASDTEFVHELIEAERIAVDLSEPLEAMAEANLALSTIEPGHIEGQFRRSYELLVELDRPVYDLHGEHLLGGYQPADLPARIAAMDSATRKDLRSKSGH